MSDFLFDIPLWVPAILAIVGIALFFNGNKLGVSRLQHAGLAVIGLAVVWLLLTLYVDTGKKIVRRQTKDFVQFAVDREWPKFQALMIPAASFPTVSVTGADNITVIATRICDTAQVKFARVQNLAVEETGSLILRQFRYSEPAGCLQAAGEQRMAIRLGADEPGMEIARNPMPAGGWTANGSNRGGLLKGAWR